MRHRGMHRCPIEGRHLVWHAAAFKQLFNGTNGDDLYLYYIYQHNTESAHYPTVPARNKSKGLCDKTHFLPEMEGGDAGDWVYLT